MADKSFGVKEVNVLGSSGTASITSPTNININSSVVGISTGLTVGGISTFSGNVNGTSFRSNDTTGDGTDVGFAIKYNITANGSSDYRFAGPGVLNTTNDPTLYLQRGFTYIFNNTSGGHPFRIQFTGTTTGVGTYVSGSQTGEQVFTIPHDAPTSYEYQCTAHSSMKGTLNIPT
tara:strand:- start:31 stop:555 length:525 start_codon:yes stop_codon:yes gene_type:complete